MTLLLDDSTAMSNLVDKKVHSMNKLLACNYQKILYNFLVQIYIQGLTTNFGTLNNRNLTYNFRKTMEPMCENC